MGFYHWLRNSLVLAICRWIINNAVSLVAIPVTVLAIVVSLNANLFKETSSKVRGTSDYFKIDTYYKFFEKQENIQIDSMVPKQEIHIIPDTTTKYTHLIYIDRTYSTKIKEELFSVFKTRIRASVEIGEENRHLNIENDSLKNCLFAYFLQKLFLEKGKAFCNVNRIYIRFFDGNICSPYMFNSPPKGIYRPENEYLDVQKITEDKFDEELSNLLKFPLLTLGLNETRKQDQKSNFDTLFCDLSRQCKKFTKDNKLIVTIISDFDHDDSAKISFNNLREKIPLYFSKKKEIIRQYNLIVYPPSSATAHLSDTLINAINGYIIDYDNVIKIDLKNFGNDFIKDETKWNKKWENFDSQYNASFYSTNMDKDFIIEFYYPKKNVKGIDMPYAKISFKNCLQWRLIDNSKDEKISSNRYMYSIENKEDVDCYINGNRNICDTTTYTRIDVSMQNEPQIESKYKLEVVTNDGRILSYPIEFKEYIQGKLPNFGIWLLNILQIIIVFIFISTLIVWIYHYYEFIYSNRRKIETFFILGIWILLTGAFLLLQLKH